MNRRRFLKYAGATAAVIGASALGVNYVARQSASIESPTSSTTVTRQVATTTSPFTMSTQTVELASLRGRLFFDYNGNGVQDAEERAVAGAPVELRNDAGVVIAQALSDSSGDYRLEDVKAGSYNLHVVADLFSDKKLRYMCRSSEDFTPLAEGYEVLLGRSQRVDIGLMEGFLTLPFPSSIPIDVADYFDHDSGINRMWWNGRRLSGSGGHKPPHTHPGIDFLMAKETEIKAAMSGKIEGINTTPGGVYWVSLVSRDGYGTTYLHIDKPLVSTGMSVKRGQAIALSCETGSPGSPHLEFQLWRHLPDGNDYCIDPYSPVAQVPKGAWIAGTWKWCASDEEWVSQGYWTKYNDPRYAL